MLNTLMQKWRTFFHLHFAVWMEDSQNLDVCDFSFGVSFAITNTSNYSRLELSFAKQLVTLQELSWRGVALRKEPSQKWKTVGTTNIYVHTDTYQWWWRSHHLELYWYWLLGVWPWLFFRKKREETKRKPGRIIFCSHLPWGKSRANSVILMELVQSSTCLNENITFICWWGILPSLIPYFWSLLSPWDTEGFRFGFWRGEGGFYFTPERINCFTSLEIIEQFKLLFFMACAKVGLIFHHNCSLL